MAVAAGQASRATKKKPTMSVRHTFPSASGSASMEAVMRAATEVLYTQFLKYEASLSQGERR